MKELFGSRRLLHFLLGGNIGAAGFDSRMTLGGWTQSALRSHLASLNEIFLPSNAHDAPCHLMPRLVLIRIAEVARTAMNILPAGHWLLPPCRLMSSQCRPPTAWVRWSAYPRARPATKDFGLAAGTRERYCRQIIDKSPPQSERNTCQLSERPQSAHRPLCKRCGLTNGEYPLGKLFGRFNE